MRIWAGALAAVLLLAACDATMTRFSVRNEAARAEVSEMTTSVVIVRLMDDNMAAFSQPRPLGREQPSRHPLTDVSLMLLNAINVGGGLSPEADARAVAPRGGRQVYTVDLQAFVEASISSNNPLLRSGDVVSVPKIVKQGSMRQEVGTLRFELDENYSGEREA